MAREISRPNEATDLLVSHIQSYGNIPSDVKIYAYEKDKKQTGDYIVVNHLQFDEERFEVCGATFLVNIHAKDNLKEQINRTKLNGYVNKVIELFADDVNLGGYWFELGSVSSPMADDDSTHFVSIRLNINYSNF